MKGGVKKVIYFKTKPLAAFKNDILKINCKMLGFMVEC